MFLEADPTHRKTAKVVGALVLISYAGVFVGNAISSAVIDQVDVDLERRVPTYVGSR